MTFLHLGGHPALDFLNTRYTPPGETVETLPDGPAFLAWLVATGLLDAGEAARLKRNFGRKALDEAAGEARGVREWARGWMPRWREAPQDDHRRVLAELNRLLGRVPIHRAIVAGESGPAVVDRAQVTEPAALIGLVAAQFAALLATEDPALLKRCAGAGCSLWFVDRTKAHRRVYCSAAACGNRAKVSAFRARAARSSP
jgi:predicted RNA-binding Zn ribbon-like protein